MGERRRGSKNKGKREESVDVFSVGECCILNEGCYYRVRATDELQLRSLEQSSSLKHQGAFCLYSKVAVRAKS